MPPTETVLTWVMRPSADATGCSSAAAAGGQSVSAKTSEKVLIKVVVATMAISAPIAFRALLTGSKATKSARKRIRVNRLGPTKQEHVGHIRHPMIGDVLQRRSTRLQAAGSTSHQRPGEEVAPPRWRSASERQRGAPRLLRLDRDHAGGLGPDQEHVSSRQVFRFATAMMRLPHLAQPRKGGRAPVRSATSACLTHVRASSQGDRRIAHPGHSGQASRCVGRAPSDV